MMFAGPEYQWLSNFVPHAADKYTWTALASTLPHNLSAMDLRACFFIMQAWLQILPCLLTGDALLIRLLVFLHC